MREILIELLKQSAPFPILKVLGTDKETSVVASSECKTFIFRAFLKQHIPEFAGEFGITNLSLLKGLLEFPAYRSDLSTFNIKRRKIGEREIVEQFEFAAGKSSKTSAIFRLTSPDLIPEITTMTGKASWDVEFIPDRAVVTQFLKLASIHSEVSKTFVPYTDNGDLVFSVGDTNSSTHSASMVFQESVTGDVTGNLQYPVGMFSTAMKLAESNPLTLSFKSRSGPMKFSIETELATYEYIIRASR